MKLTKGSNGLATSDRSNSMIAETKTSIAASKGKHNMFGVNLDHRILKKVSQGIFLVSVSFFLQMKILYAQKQVVRNHDDVGVQEMSIISAPSHSSNQFNSSMSETTMMCASAEMKYLYSYPEVEETVRSDYSSGFDHWIKVGRSAGLEYKCSTKSPRQFWINAIGIGEGIGAWRRSLSELLFLAKELSATAVEPCMKDGRLGSCGKRFWLPVSQVMDLSWAFRSSDDRLPLMASYKDYQKQLQKFRGRRTNHTLCLHLHHDDKKNKKKKRKSGCVLDGTSLIKDILDTEQLTNINIYSFWKDSMEILHSILKIPLHDTLQPRTLSFHPQHIHTVQKVLQSANISNAFSVIHWRAEKKGMNLMECANAVLKTRHVMEEIDSTTKGDTLPYLLMTSLNEDPSKKIITPLSFSQSQYACLISHLPLFIHQI